MICVMEPCDAASLNEALEEGGLRKLKAVSASACAPGSGLKRVGLRVAEKTAVSKSLSVAEKNVGSGLSNQAIDLQLINHVKQGNKRAFDMLVLKYQSRVVKLISRYVYDQAEVLDIAQETFLKVYRALPGFRGDSAFYTWLYRIAVNTAKNHFVHSSRRPPAFDVDVSDAEQSTSNSYLSDHQTPEQLLLRDEVGNTVMRAVEALSDDLRVAITLREIDGLSYEEIAIAMDCPIGTVRSRISRARESISDSLQALSTHQHI